MGPPPNTRPLLLWQERVRKLVVHSEVIKVYRNSLRSERAFGSYNMEGGCLHNTSITNSGGKQTPLITKVRKLPHSIYFLSQPHFTRDTIHDAPSLPFLSLLLSSPVFLSVCFFFLLFSSPRLLYFAPTSYPLLRLAVYFYLSFIRLIINSRYVAVVLDVSRSSYQSYHKVPVTHNSHLALRSSAHTYRFHP